MANTVSITVDADTKKAEKSVKGMGDKFRSAMKGVAVAAGAVTLAAGAAAKLGQEYQEATNTIAAGTGASGDQLKGLTKSFKGVWKAVRGGTYQDGTPVTKPVDLDMAEIIDNICQRYSCLPSELMGEDVGILRTLAIVGEGKVEDKGG